MSDISRTSDNLSACERENQTDIVNNDNNKEEKQSDLINKITKNYILASNISMIFLMLAIPLLAFVSIYICASPVAFTNQKMANDVIYSVKEIGKIDFICTMIGVFISVYSIIVYAFSELFYKKICNSLTRSGREIEQEMPKVVKTARKNIRLNIIKTVLFDVFLVLVIITNHVIN